MSRGLGRIEGAVLAALRLTRKKLWTHAVCIHVFAPHEYCPESGDYGRFEPTNAQLKSVLRACKSLERKGLIEFSPAKCWNLSGHDGHGGRTHANNYVLKPSQH